MKNLSSYIDHTLLKQDANIQSIKKLCQEADEYDFCSVCVNSCYVKDAKEFLENQKVKVCSVVGFPLGAISTKAKAYEAKCAIEDGADEIDMVINVGWVKSDRYDLVESDIKELRLACKDVTLKVIFETALLSEDEIRKISKICKELKVDFVKTSTGFSTRGASLRDVEIMKSVVGDDVFIKAAGGIRSYEKALEMIKAGANRLGTSSGVAIVKGDEAQKGSY